METCSWLLNVLLCTSEGHYLSSHTSTLMQKSSHSGGKRLTSECHQENHPIKKQKPFLTSVSHAAASFKAFFSYSQSHFSDCQLKIGLSVLMHTYPTCMYYIYNGVYWYSLILFGLYKKCSKEESEKTSIIWHCKILILCPNF